MDHIRGSDPRLARVMDQVGPCTLAPQGADEPYHSLVETIVYQQLTARAAGTIFSRVATLCPESSHLTPERISTIPDRSLAGCGLSRPKIAAIRDLTRQVTEGSLVLHDMHTLDPEALGERLLEVKGIGPWSVHMYLIFRLGHPDVWPVTDLGIRKGARRVWNLRALPTPEQVMRRGQKLSPHRTVAAWYLWRSLELP